MQSRPLLMCVSIGQELDPDKRHGHEVVVGG